MAGPALAKKKKSKKAAPLAPAKLHVRGFDAKTRALTVEISGLEHPPAANYFTFTDSDKRHFIAASIRCEPAENHQAQLCHLEIPIGYERHQVISLGLHRGGLHGPETMVDAKELAAVWPSSATSADGGTP